MVKNSTEIEKKIEKKPNSNYNLKNKFLTKNSIDLNKQYNNTFNNVEHSSARHFLSTSEIKKPPLYQSIIKPGKKEYSDIFINRSNEDIHQTVDQIFKQNKFKITWHTHFSGKAYRGNKIANFAAGVFLQYFEIDFMIFRLPNEEMGIRLIRSNSGWIGGALGAMRVNKQYHKIVEMLTNSFRPLGIYGGKYPL